MSNRSTSLTPMRIQFISQDTAKLVGFYKDALGFQIAPGREGTNRHPDTSHAAAADLAMTLGDQTVDLVAAQPDARPYPTTVAGWDCRFQHIAIVVSDMDAAWARLKSTTGWRPISVSGPEQLPASSGGVKAYKFRDPEGHPLELLAFPPDREPDVWKQHTAHRLHLGIDHSALSVADSGRSIAFYQELGFEVQTRSHNVGPEQTRLDGLIGADVEVTSMTLDVHSGPHLELLCYRGDFDRSAKPASVRDVAATRIVLLVKDQHILEELCSKLPSPLVAAHRTNDGHAARVLIRDPDWHVICFQVA